MGWGIGVGIVTGLMVGVVSITIWVSSVVGIGIVSKLIVGSDVALGVGSGVEIGNGITEPAATGVDGFVVGFILLT